MFSSVVEPRRELHQQKCMVTVWLSTVSLIHYSLLGPGGEILSENRQRAPKASPTIVSVDQQKETSSFLAQYTYRTISIEEIESIGLRDPVSLALRTRPFAYQLKRNFLTFSGVVVYT